MATSTAVSLFLLLLDEVIGIFPGFSDRRFGDKTMDVSEAAVSLANRLIVRFDVDIPRISSLSELPSSFYITLFEAIWCTSVPDVINVPQNLQEEEHNIQSLVDTLSMDILNVPLSHISGEAVVAAKPQAVYNLLEIFLGYAILMSPSLLESHTNYSSDCDNCKLCKCNAERLDSRKIESREMEQVHTRNSHSSQVPVLHMSTNAMDTERYMYFKEEDFVRSFPNTGSENHAEKGVQTSIKTICTESIDGENEETCADSGWMSNRSSNASVMANQQIMDEQDSSYFVPLDVSQIHQNESPSEIPTMSEMQANKRCDLFHLRQAVSTQDQISQLTKNQIRLLSSRLHSLLTRTTKPKQLYDDAIKRQKAYLKLEKEDITEKRRVKCCAEDRDTKIKIRSAFNTNSLQRARVKQYYGKYYLQHRNKMMAKDKTAEEVMLIQLLKRRLALQKETLHALNRDMREFEQKQILEHQGKIASHENFYEDQLSMMQESEKNKKSQFEIRKKAQAKKKRDENLEHRQKLERGIKCMQDVLLRDPFTVRMTDHS